MNRRIFGAYSSSRTQGLYERVRADVLSCRLRPNEKITIVDLCKEHQVSPGAVREALSRLTSEGLVTAEPQRGFWVAPVSENDLKQLTEARMEIERLCLERAIAGGDLGWEASLVAAYHELSRTPERVRDDEVRLSEDWASAHSRFHQALVEACDNVWLLRLRTQLYAQAERYRRLSVPLGVEKRDLNLEHKDIMEAALARDIDQACKHLGDHIRATTRIILNSGAVQRIFTDSVAA